MGLLLVDRDVPGALAVDAPRGDFSLEPAQRLTLIFDPLDLSFQLFKSAGENMQLLIFSLLLVKCWLEVDFLQ